MDNGGFIDEVIRKCSIRRGSKSTKKKSSDSIIFSTLLLMKSVSNDDEVDSQLKSAINGEDLSKIR